MRKTDSLTVEDCWKKSNIEYELSRNTFYNFLKNKDDYFLLSSLGNLSDAIEFLIKGTAVKFNKEFSNTHDLLRIYNNDILPNIDSKEELKELFEINKLIL